MTYQEWVFKWLKIYVEPSAKQRTYLNYSNIMRLHILPNIGHINLSELTVLKLQNFVNSLLIGGNCKTGKGLSSSFVNVIISIIKISLKTAYLMGFTEEYIADRIKRPKFIEKKIECFSVAEQKKIETAVLNDKRDKMFGVVLCLYTGLRIGELLALTWKDIDFEKKLLSVSKTCYDRNIENEHVRVIDTPKTPTSWRIIPIPIQLIPHLKTLKKRSQCEYVIADKTKPVFVRSYQRTFELMLQKLNIPHRGIHSLRHTFATRALECGMDVKTLSEILGHKNATITLNRYAHSMMEHKTAMMNRLGKLF